MTSHTAGQYVTRAIDGFVLSVDLAALFHDRSLVQTSTYRAARSKDTNSVVVTDC